MTIWRSNSIFGCCHWSVLTSFHFRCFLILHSPKALVPRDPGWLVSAKFSSIFSAVLSQDPSGLWSKVPYHFFSDPGPRKDQWPLGNLRAYSLIVFEVFSHISSFPYASHTMSLNIDMKMTLPAKFCGSHCNYPISCWIWFRIPTVVNPVKIVHSNSISCPSFRFNSLK